MLLSTFYISLLASSVSLCYAQTGVDVNRTFEVGVILDFDSLVGQIGLTSLSLAMTDFYSTNPNYITRLVLHLRDSKGRVINAAANALGLLKDVEVEAIIGPQKSSQANFVIDLGDIANVPIICFSATSPFLHQRSQFFVQTSLSDAAQVGAIAAIVGYFNWRQVVLVYEDSEYGNGIIPYLANAFQDVNARVSYRSIIPLTATDDSLLQELYKMKTMQTRVFVVHVSSSVASKLFVKAKEAGMMGEGYAWIVTSGVMDLFYSLDSNVVDSMQGVLGVKPLIPKSRKLNSLAKRWKRKFLADNPDALQAELSLYSLWAYDTFWALAIAAESIGLREPAASNLQINPSVNGSTNLFTTKVSRTGPKILEAMSRVTFQGFSGKFRLVEGKLEASTFQILNVYGEGEREVGIWTSSEGILSRRNLKGTSSSNKKLMGIIFPGHSTVTPRGWEVPVSGKKLRVGVPKEAGFKEFVQVKTDPKTNSSNVTGCYIDIFEAAIKKLPYAVSFEYFPFKKSDGSSAEYYNELTHQIYLGNFDAVVGDLTITSKRSRYVDFTLPFAAGGVTVIMKHEDITDQWIFLEPLSGELWVTSIALFLFTGLALWILEHKFNQAYRGQPAQQAGMILSFPFMSLVFAHSEKIVSNLARLVMVVWMFVVLILTSTFTARLSANLTVQRLKDISYEQLVRGKENVGCRNGSFICNFLQESGISNSRIKPCQTPELCEIALSKGNKSGGINALFTVRPYANLFLSKSKEEYTAVGQITPTDGFAFAFPKGSPLVDDVSSQIISLMEEGEISRLEHKWKTGGSIYDDVLPKETKMTLQSFTVLYSITGGLTTLCLAIFVTTYLYKNRDFVQRIWSSDSTVWSKFVAVSKHFDERDPTSFRDTEEGENASPNSRHSST